MLELAHAGANVLHPRSVETAKLNHVPLRVRSSFKTDDLGTLILGVEKMEIDRPVTGVAADLSQTRVVVCDVPDIPGQAASIFTKLAQENISVDMIIQSYARKISHTNDIAFTVDAADTDKTIATLEAIKASSQLQCGEIQVDKEIAKVSIVGAGMIDRPGIASSMFDTLAKLGVNIKMISTSEIKISCLVDKEDAQKAVKALHEEFGLESDVVADVKGDLPNV
jgi:aspartate kinase